MKRIGFLLLAVLLLCSTTFAAVSDAPAHPLTYGTSSETAYVVSAQELSPITSTMTWGYFIGGRYTTTTSGAAFETTLRLPEGSLITRLVMDSCDNSTTGEVQVWINKCVSPFNACTIVGQTTSGILFSDGGACESVETVLPTPEQVDNVANVYYVHAQNDGSFTNATRINAVRIYYKLQVKPGPDTATFNDVPKSSSIFKFVEALYASGITAGCGNNNYCPDAPVTRGQMAVFLSVALGLHWAP